MTMSIDVKPGYESVRDLFFDLSAKTCCQLCVYVGEEKVVDLVASVPEVKDNNNAAYNHDSLQVVFSSSKVMTSAAVAIMVDRGFLRYSDKIKDFWPEFAQNGKQDLTVSDVLRHQSGLSRIKYSYDMSDFFPENLVKNSAGKGIEIQEIEPSHVDHDGTIRRHYHYFSRGYIANEVCRRVDPLGRTLGQILDDHFEKFGIDAYVGVSPTKQTSIWNRILDLRVPSWASVVWKMSWNFLSVLKAINHGFWCYPNLVLRPRMAEGIATFWDLFPNVSRTPVCPCSVTDSKTKKPFNLRPWNLAAFFNSEAYKRSEQPGCNGIASARGLAKLASFLANKGTVSNRTLISEDTWEAMHGEEVVSPELEVGGIRTQFSQGGINHFKDYDDDQSLEKRFKSGRDGYRGWMGFGGSVCQYNPDLKIGFGYAPLDCLFYDLANSKAALLQAEVVKCVKNLNK